MTHPNMLFLVFEIVLKMLHLDPFYMLCVHNTIKHKISYVRYCKT
jgi:hypothetical protein